MRLFCSLVVLVLLAAATPSAAKGVHRAASASFDVKAATDAYLNSLPSEKRGRSDAYFEGGYWLMLADFALVAAVAFGLLAGRVSARMRDAAERVSRIRFVQTGIYWLEYFFITTLIGFPLAVYEGYFREHKYGLATQTFGRWLTDRAIALALGAVLGGLLVMALFALVRRLKRSWWIWGAGVTIVFAAVLIVIAPVYIFPLFNKYTKLTDEKVRQPILRLARANGIPVDDVYQMDASRQTNKISANVSGFLGTERVTLNDNLLGRCSLEEIEAVMGHEMGHYVLNHVYKALLFYSVLIVIGFAWMRISLAWILRRYGARFGLRGVDDPAILPAAFFLIGLFFFVLTPITNSYTRTMEYEADLFGLNAARQPEGAAKVFLKLSDYRKLDPSPLEEMVLYDHPSGRTRITAAMRWKAELSR
jgi:STE24 endopeptidase